MMHRVPSLKLQLATRFAAGLAVAGFLLSGCASVSQQSNLMKRGEMHEIRISGDELRIRVRSLAGTFSGIVEQTGDEIISLPEASPSVRLRALNWKIKGVPSFQTALFQPDPLAALIDAWAQVYQVRNNVEDRSTSELPDDAKQIIYVGLDRMEAELIEIADDLGPEDAVERLRTLAQSWAIENPIVNLSSRPPTTSELAALTANSQIGIRGTVSALNETVADLATRIDVYTTFMPSQARWQAEYLLHDLIGDTDLSGTLSDIEGMVDSVDTIARTVDGIPGLVAAERLAVLQAVREERIAALETIHQEVRDLFKFVSSERRALITENLRAERIAVVEAITAERIATLDAIHQERVETLADVEAMSQRLIEDSVTQVVDHVLIRIAQGLIVLLALGALLALLVLRWSRQRRAT